MKSLLLLTFFLVGVTVAVGQTTGTESDYDFMGETEQSINHVTAEPNPFKEKTTITFYSDSAQTVVFELKNILGESVFLIKNDVQEGENTITLTREDIPSGMYIYTLQTDQEVVSKRLVIK
ncbi:MAG: hypothetical protein CSA40_00300 [Flavobacteriales bacterium]|nr:MAG: hypothetical protein CSA40_00300 [Flavobacteriales bacterium]